MAVVFLSLFSGKLVAIAVTDGKDSTEHSSRYRGAANGFCGHVML